MAFTRVFMPGFRRGFEHPLEHRETTVEGGPPPVTLTSIAVTPTNPSINIGGTQQMVATGTYDDASTQDITGSVTWSSGTPANATVSAGGLVTGVAHGTSVITATQGFVSGTTTVTSNRVLSSIDVTPNTPSVQLGATQQMTATGTYNDASTANLTGTVTWGSATPAAATISAGGLVTSVAVGTSVISATLGAIVGNETVSAVDNRQTITAHHLETASNTSTLTVHTTGTITPTANRLVLLCIMPTVGTAAPPTVTGCGLTWVNVNTVSSGNRRLSMFRAMGAAPSAGVVTIDWAAVPVASCVWSLNEFGGVDQSGTDGAGAVVQNDTAVDAGGTATTLQTTLAAFEHVNNVHFASFGLSTAATITPDPDFIELGDDSEIGNNATIETEWAVNQLTCDPTFTAAVAYGVAIEIKAAVL